MVSVCSVFIVRGRRPDSHKHGSDTTVLSWQNKRSWWRSTTTVTRVNGKRWCRMLYECHRVQHRTAARLYKTEADVTGGMECDRACSLTSWCSVHCWMLMWVDAASDLQFVLAVCIYLWDHHIDNHLVQPWEWWWTHWKVAVNLAGIYLNTECVCKKSLIIKL